MKNVKNDKPCIDAVDGIGASPIAGATAWKTTVEAGHDPADGKEGTSLFIDLADELGAAESAGENAVESAEDTALAIGNYNADPNTPGWKTGFFGIPYINLEDTTPGGENDGEGDGDIEYSGFAKAIGGAATAVYDFFADLLSGDSEGEGDGTTDEESKDDTDEESEEESDEDERPEDSSDEESEKRPTKRATKMNNEIAIARDRARENAMMTMMKEMTAGADRPKILATAIRGAVAAAPIPVRAAMAGRAVAAKRIRPPIAAPLSRVAIAIRAIPIPDDRARV